MKNLILISLLFLTVNLFADDFIVIDSKSAYLEIIENSVITKIEIQKDQLLSISSRIDIGLNGRLVLKDKNDSIKVINSMKKGTIENLLNKPSVRITGTVYQSKENTSIRNTSNVSTASTRASEATKDFNWEE
jgi:hypothetical protein